jgi:hypothetical protein
MKFMVQLCMRHLNGLQNAITLRCWRFFGTYCSSIASRRNYDREQDRAIPLNELPTILDLGRTNLRLLAHADRLAVIHMDHIMSRREMSLS